VLSNVGAQNQALVRAMQRLPTKSLFPVVVALRQSGEAIPPMLPQAADGHRLTATNTEVRKLQP